LAVSTLYGNWRRRVPTVCFTVICKRKPRSYLGRDFGHCSLPGWPLHMSGLRCLPVHWRVSAHSCEVPVRACTCRGTPLPIYEGKSRRALEWLHRWGEVASLRVRHFDLPI